MAGDLDGDGDLDAAATSWRTPGRVAWFRNHGRPGEPWTMHLLKEDWRSANQILIADLDGKRPSRHRGLRRKEHPGIALVA